MDGSRNICRSCLTEEKALLSMDSTVDDTVLVVDCFKIHLNINISENDGLPYRICLDCLDQMLQIRKFHLQFLESEKFLLQQYKNSKDEVPIYETTGYSLPTSSMVCTLDFETSSIKESRVDYGAHLASRIESGKPDPESTEQTKIEVLDNDCSLNLSSTYSTESYEVFLDNEKKNGKTNGANDERRLLHRKKYRRLIYCLQCHEQFKTKNELRTHFNSEHGKDNARGFCNQCSTTFPTRGKLMAHLHSHPEPKPSYRCSYCDKHFKQKHILEYHERTHTGGKPHLCSICGRGFSQSSILYTHMSLHTGKTVNCPRCDKKFSRKSFLKIHLRSHDDIRPYACHLCEKNYRIKSHLDSHILTHSDVRNFVCDIWDKLLERSLRFVVTFRFIQDPINALNVHWKGDVCIFLFT
ncbi:zinc finger protein 300-like isoform X2 [Hermetia illucens]|uniref:zinc finger protein 300-like isoform X2 n=1 Tax=Hermetia illucens TaxID=343691 RepID=UPI0018CC1681|nr:zinc finger protein 300-like isoform X2 [Hermetia illucens]